MNPTNRILLTVLLLAPAATAQAGASTYGHARTREIAELGRLPSPAEVAVIDLINYHRHRLPLPRAGREVELDVRFGGSAVGVRGQAILQIGMTTAPADERRDLPPVNLALVIDCSGSMAAAGKLDQVRRALGVFVRRLRPIDRVALITYENEARIEQESRRRDDGRWLHEAIARLEPGGATNLHAGLMLGLREVATHARANTSNRVILLTDGIANRGVTDPESILRDARHYTAEDIDLSTIGVGRELNTELLDRLARGGRGLFHFVADPEDVQKVFAAEVASLLAPSARSVRLRVEVSPDLVLERVYGYDDEVERLDGGFAMDLPDMNRGLTAVVLATFRAAPGAERPTRAKATARLDYREPIDGARRSARGVAEIRVRRRGGEALADAEVRKNFTIATVAQGMFEMACHSEGRCWAAADRALREALHFARKQFPSGEDEDVAAAVRMAEAYQSTLGRYVDRFRDG